MKIKPIFCLSMLSVLLLLWGCQESSLTFQVRFDKVLGLQKDDPVYFEHNPIGRVEKISYTGQGDYLATITITPEFKNAATEHSTFFIDASPINPGQKAVIVVQDNQGGAVLEQGVIVQGSVRAGYLDTLIGELRKSADVAEGETRQAIRQLQEKLDMASRQLDTELRGALDEISRQFQQFGHEMKKVPDSPEVKELEESIQRFVNEFNKAREDVREHIREEVLPRLRRELDQLREQLQKEDREQELEKIDKQVEGISVV
jgi:ABC-type transporter Mla subunit MlaD